ncbi:MAG TPA: hypothetical protein VN838_05625 [Bradyrhizobium sp.]|nr:hypothetical protein [Bradyrhizobium sp.]
MSDDPEMGELTTAGVVLETMERIAAYGERAVDLRLLAKETGLPRPRLLHDLMGLMAAGTVEPVYFNRWRLKRKPE